MEDSRDSEIDYAFKILNEIRKSANLSKEEKTRMDIAIESLANETAEMQTILERKESK